MTESLRITGVASTLTTITPLSFGAHATRKFLSTFIKDREQKVFIYKGTGKLYSCCERVNAAQ